MLAFAGSSAATASAQDAGADYLLMRVDEPAAGDPVDLRPLGGQPARRAVFLDNAAEPARLHELASGGVVAVLCADAGRLLDRHPITALAAFAERAGAAGVAFGFAGALETPDVPRLLALRPDLLCLDLDMASAHDAALFARLCHGIPEPVTAGASDVVFVRDLDLQLEVGAYRAERGRRQRVRFSIEARVARPAGHGATMGTVYSYDLLTDAVAIVAARGHTDFVETLAEDIAALVLLDPRVLDVIVRVEKLDLGPRTAGIEIRRAR